MRVINKIRLWFKNQSQSKINITETESHVKRELSNNPYLQSRALWNDMYGAIETTLVVDVNHLNFNYDLSGDNPFWKLVQVFDDSAKTFIRMTPLSERLDLPVLYIRRRDEMQLINYRYRRPYYVVDLLVSPNKE